MLGDIPDGRVDGNPPAIAGGHGFNLRFGKILHTVDNFSEKAMESHSSTLAWKIPWTEEPGGLQSMGLLEVRHD